MLIFSPVNFGTSSTVTFHSEFEESNKFNLIRYSDCRSTLDKFIQISEYFLHNYAFKTTSDWFIYTTSTKIKCVTSFRNKISNDNQDWKPIEYTLIGLDQGCATQIQDGVY